jgi:hypothetical protein
MPTKARLQFPLLLHSLPMAPNRLPEPYAEAPDYTYNCAMGCEHVVSPADFAVTGGSQRRMSRFIRSHRTLPCWLRLHSVRCQRLLTVKQYRGSLRRPSAFGAVCGKSARTDPRGGYGASRIPTATLLHPTPQAAQLFSVPGTVPWAGRTPESGSIRT